MLTTCERFDIATASRTRFELVAVTLQDDGVWPGLRLEQWEGSGGELPETVLFQHGVMLNLDTLRSTEISWSGHRLVSGNFGPGTFGMFPAGLPYKGSSKGASNHLVVAITPEFLRSVVSASSAQAVELVPGAGLSDGFVWQACHALANDVREQHPCGPMYGESIVVALAAHLARHHSADPRVGAEYLRASDQKRSRVRDFILDRLDQSLSLADMASFAQLDVYSFARWFKTAFGVPPHRYVLMSRIERARVLLKTSTESLVDIALQCGFSSQSHLAVTFRRFVGVSPKVYRASSSRS